MDSRDLIKYFEIPEKIIGITGTNGKTTTANLIYNALIFLGKKAAMLGTQGLFFNQRQIKTKGLTTPGVLELYEDLDFLAHHQCEILVMEVSSHAIDQNRICGLNFCAKILTQITSDHLDYHHCLEEYIRVKNSFFQDDGLKIINQDEKKVVYNQINALTYGLSQDSNLCVEDYDLSRGILATLCFKHGDSQKREIKLSSPLYGKHNLYNLLAAFLCIEMLFGESSKKKQYSTFQILESLEDLKGVRGRMEVVSENPLVIVDFAHTHDGMERIFESFEDCKIVVVFGAGGDRDRTKRPLMGEVAARLACRIFITSDNPRSEDPLAIIGVILSGIKNYHQVVVEPDRKKAIQSALESLQQDEVLLILGKGDETYQILKDRVIDFDDKEVVRELLGQTISSL